MVQTAEQYEFVHRALYLFEQTLDSQPSISSNWTGYFRDDYFPLFLEKGHVIAHENMRSASSSADGSVNL